VTERNKVESKRFQIDIDIDNTLNTLKIYRRKGQRKIKETIIDNRTRALPSFSSSPFNPTTTNQNPTTEGAANGTIITPNKTPVTLHIRYKSPAEKLNRDPSTNKRKEKIQKHRNLIFPSSQPSL
jgi:hypothetical protein